MKSAFEMPILQGGVTCIGESRLQNIHRLRAHGINTSYMQLRILPRLEVEEVIASVDISLNSELRVITALAYAAHRRRLVHEVIVMVALGDLREGVWPDDLVPFVRHMIYLPGIRLVGLGTNLSCL